VFAAGTPGSPTTEELDLFVKDFEANTITPLDATQLGDGLSSDHPVWSPDGSPDRPGSTVTTQANTPITIELECTDTGPAYERTGPSGFVAGDGAPQHGTTSNDAPTANPSTVRYTPSPGFTGTDRIGFTSFDAFGFGTDKGTVTINVTAPAGGGGGGSGDTGGDRDRAGGGAPLACAGRTATIVGTPGDDALLGSAVPDRRTSYRPGRRAIRDRP
jgi:hypothetical protein